MSDNPSPLHATHAQLLRATTGALLAGAVILITTVLPAEYGVDPTGIGKALGLTALSRTGETAAQEQATPPSAAETVIAYDAPYQSREMSLTLQPNEGAEIKALMRAGESFVFGWTTDGGAVNFDMHGEKQNAGDEFSSYWKDRDQSEAHGRFIAPFDGTHGWWWKNRGSESVTVTVKMSGYFEKLYMP